LISIWRFFVMKDETLVLIEGVATAVAMRAPFRR
jgi:hypothetical protein